MTRRPPHGVYRKIERAPSSAPVSSNLLSDLRPVLLEALCYHEALLRLSYEPEEIFVSPREGVLSVVLVVGDRRFFITVGPLVLDDTYTRESFLKEWDAACEVWNKASDSDRLAAFEKSFVYGASLDFCATLALKGFNRHMRKATGRSN